MFKNTFEYKFNNAQEWQKQRYLRLAEHFKWIELSDEDKRYLLWLSGYDGDTEKVFSGLFDRLAKRIAALEGPVQVQLGTQVLKIDGKEIAKVVREIL